jgi:hypothetical protein
VRNISPCQQQIRKGTTSKALLVSSSIGVVGVLIGYSLSWLFNQVHKENVSKTPSMSTLEHVILRQIHNEFKVKTTARSIVEHIIKRVPYTIDHFTKE